MTQTPLPMYFIGTAVIDLSNTDINILRQWLDASVVIYQVTGSPTGTACSIWFASSQPIPGAVAASSVVYLSLNTDTVI